MPVQNHARQFLPRPDRPGAARGAAALLAASSAKRRVVRSDGTEEGVGLPPSALPALSDLLERLATPETVTVLADDAELMPEEAAAVLGMSRPLVRRRMDPGLLPFRRVGEHRRVRLDDARARGGPA